MTTKPTLEEDFMGENIEGFGISFTHFWSLLLTVTLCLERVFIRGWPFKYEGFCSVKQILMKDDSYISCSRNLFSNQGNKICPVYF